jgi:hypothetical protein
MERTFKSMSISPNLFKKFINDFKAIEQEQSKLFASKMLYEMVVDPYYAS